MKEKTNKLTLEWKPFSELRPVEKDISNRGYKKRYIEKHSLDKTRQLRWHNYTTGAMGFYEPLEVMLDGTEIFWRQNMNTDMNPPKYFNTQFGIFNNHNNGEFISWLGKDGCDGLLTREKEIHNLFGRDDFLVEGNYCDMFDSGKYSIGISNQMHLGLGKFKIIRIDENLIVETIYDNEPILCRSCLRYIGRFQRDGCWFVIASGSIKKESTSEGKSKRHDKTILFRIDEKGNCEASAEWNTMTSAANSFADAGDFVYLGQNMMVTRLNILTGEMDYYTDKSNEEIGAMVEI